MNGLKNHTRFLLVVTTKQQVPHIQVVSNKKWAAVDISSKPFLLHEGTHPQLAANIRNEHKGFSKSRNLSFLEMALEINVLERAIKNERQPGEDYNESIGYVRTNTQVWKPIFYRVLGNHWPTVSCNYGVNGNRHQNFCFVIALAAIKHGLAPLHPKSKKKYGWGGSLQVDAAGTIYSNGAQPPLRLGRYISTSSNTTAGRGRYISTSSDTTAS